ncbi:MAG: TolC family protein [Deltaproteobacteria bacterium]|nr:TolC family protein [Deltaproteobacteria bacterium]MBN2672765.1 TolC family protein [Deltaproteobacteria bacterium]
MNYLRNRARQTALAAIWVCVIISGPSKHAHADESTHAVTWSQIAAAVDALPVFAQQKQELNAERAVIDTEKSAPNPTAEISVARGHSDTEADTALEWGVALNIPLDWIVTRNARVSVAEASLRVREENRKLLKREILFELRSLFWQLVYAQEHTRMLNELLQQTNTLTQTIQTRVERGEARPMELTRVQLEFEKVALERDASQKKTETLAQKLEYWLGANKPVVAVGSLKPQEGVASLRETAPQLRTHPEILRAKSELDTATAQVRVEKKSRFPELSVTLFAENELDKTSIGAGIEFGLPLWNFQQGAIRRAESNAAAKKTEIEVITRRLQREFIDASGRCEASTYQAVQFELRIIPKVANVAAKTDRAYALGEASLLEVINAHRDVLETQTLLLETQLQARLDCSDLSALMSTED